MSRGVALFAQYHPQGRILPHVHHAISALLDADLAVHVAVAGQPDFIGDEAYASLRKRGAVFHTRLNEGLDFGSWQFLLRTGCADGAARVLLVNDSVLGPFRPLAPLLDAMSASPAWGMVASRQMRAHLQSWFVSLDGHVLQAAPVQRVFAQDFAAMSRDEIIHHGEIGLSVALDCAAISWSARWPPPVGAWSRLGRLLPANPAHADWRGMLDDVPYMKIELLRDDPGRVAPPAHWQATLTGLGYPLAWAQAAIDASPRRSSTALNWRGKLVQRLSRS